MRFFLNIKIETKTIGELKDIKDLIKKIIPVLYSSKFKNIIINKNIDIAELKLKF